MPTFERTKIGNLALVQETEDGRIIQLGMREEQSHLLQIFMASLSKESPLVVMGEEYDLVLKQNVCNKCKQK